MQSTDRINPKLKRCDRWWETNCYYNHFSLLGCSNHYKLLWQALAQSSYYLFSTIRPLRGSEGNMRSLTYKKQTPHISSFCRGQNEPSRLLRFARLTKTKQGLEKNFSQSQFEPSVMAQLQGAVHEREYWDCAPGLISSRGILSLEKDWQHIQTKDAKDAFSVTLQSNPEFS